MKKIILIGVLLCCANIVLAENAKELSVASLTVSKLLSFGRSRWNLELRN